MIRDLLLGLASALGAGALGTAIALITTYRRAGPEFPPSGRAQRGP